MKNIEVQNISKTEQLLTRINHEYAVFVFEYNYILIKLGDHSRTKKSERKCEKLIFALPGEGEEGVIMEAG